MTDWTDERMVELRNVLYAHPEHTDVHRVLRALVADRDALREALIDVLLQATIYGDGSESWPCDDMGLSSNEDAVALLVRLGVLERHPTKRRLFRLAGGGEERVGPDGSRPIGQGVPPDAPAAIEAPEGGSDG